MLEGKTVLLGVSGGIAAYKSAELVRCFSRLGASVQVVMTQNAQQFITPLTLQVLSGLPVGTDLFDMQFESEIGHIHAARAAHLVVLAPATANLIAKMAAGIADDFLTTILLATTAPILVCPAMNVKMWEHPATRRNLNTLCEMGVQVLGPGVGSLACNEEGAGRLADLPLIVEAAVRLLTPRTLAGRKVLVSAGPTWEPFDPVRFVTNPSSGKMGYVLAAVAARRGAETYLVSGPTALCAPPGVNLRRVTTAVEMYEAIFGSAQTMDAILMAAAVSDYRPSETAPQKMKKRDGPLLVTFERNPDILASLGRTKPDRQILVGFAAETENLLENATAKLHRKNLDFIVANDLTESGSGFGTDTNRVKIIERSGTVTELPQLTKEGVAERIWDRVERLWTDES